ncbi:MAG: TrkA C-terminal domain-containing protein [Actinomycetaceae bacterium]|nr:TrkA C-terminal domain-containing protein [Actinomycetaceae bacterium]
MVPLFEFLRENPLILLFILVGVGMIFGHIKVRGISLGAAAVLFFAVFMSAYAQHHGVDNMVVPHLMGSFGLIIFAFCIGITSGPNFFNAIKTSGGPIIAVLISYIVAAIAGVALGRTLGLNFSEIAGTFAGAITNTPALEASAPNGNEHMLAQATVGYSIAYLYGVIGMIIFATLALSYGKHDKDRPATIANRTVRVEREDHPHIGDIYQRHAETVTFSRLRRGEEGPISKPNMSDALEVGDLVTVVGPTDAVNKVVQELGHSSSHSLLSDRSYLDFRRITLSDPEQAGKTIAELNMGDRFGATISRVRRGDIDMVGSPDLVLQQGDRLRIVAPTSRMKEITSFLGDSARGLSSINPVALGIGIALGIALGAIPFGAFKLGSAAGALIIGLFMGKVGRIGNVVVSMPFTSCQVLSEFGLLIFLAQAGTNAGLQISVAFADGAWWKMLVVGFVITTLVGAGIYIAMRWFVKMGGTKTAGLLGGAQTQPAVLAYANARTNLDARVALGYAMIYPVAMVAKILIAKVIGTMAL